MICTAAACACLSKLSNEDRLTYGAFFEIFSLRPQAEIQLKINLVTFMS